MSPEERNRFMAAILERPADNLPRAVFADRLEEAGDEDRAAFIRLQIEMTEKPTPERYGELELIQTSMIRKHAAKWLADDGIFFPSSGFPVNKIIPTKKGITLKRGLLPEIELHYKRGFVGRIRGTLWGIVSFMENFADFTPMEYASVTGRVSHGDVYSAWYRERASMLEFPRWPSCKLNLEMGFTDQNATLGGIMDSLRSPSRSGS